MSFALNHHHLEEQPFSITKLKTAPILLGKPWLKKHNPLINWTNNSITFPSDYCNANCAPKSSCDPERKTPTPRTYGTIPYRTSIKTLEHVDPKLDQTYQTTTSRPAIKPFETTAYRTSSKIPEHVDPELDQTYETITYRPAINPFETITSKPLAPRGNTLPVSTQKNSVILPRVGNTSATRPVNIALVSATCFRQALKNSQGCGILSASQLPYSAPTSTATQTRPVNQPSVNGVTNLPETGDDTPEYS